MPPTAGSWRRSPRILSEHLAPVPAPVTLLLEPGPPAPPDQVTREAARALLDLPPLPAPVPPWLTPHQGPAVRRLLAMLERYGGAVLADAAGMGKSYVALAVAAGFRAPVTLIVPAVLIPQWRSLCHALRIDARIVGTESLSRRSLDHDPPGLVIVDEAHRFRNPETRRYRALARAVTGGRVLLVTATPVHNRIDDLLHLLRLFLRDDALTALGVPSLRLAAAGRAPGSRAGMPAVLARLVVARSRIRARGLDFPERGRHTILAAPSAPAPLEAALVTGIEELRGHAAPLLRLTLLRRLASSLAALRWSLERYAAFLDLAASADRHLEARDFQRCFARTDEGDLQLALLPLLVESHGPPVRDEAERARVAALRERCRGADDPKIDALAALLTATPMKTIVFTEAAATLRELWRRLRGRLRVAAIAGTRAWLGRDRAGRDEVLRCFAPLAQGAAPAPEVLAADVLLATDLAGEGLSLQDAARVVHYDLPWSPARLAQRVGRIDRLGSRHQTIETASFVPQGELARAIAAEERLAAKVRIQMAAGAAQLETVAGRVGLPGGSPFDWCDRLQEIAELDPPPAPPCPIGAVSAVREGPNAVVLVVHLVAGFTEAIVTDETGAHADPERATALLEQGAAGTPAVVDAERLRRALRQAAPLVQDRLAAAEDGRWRASDRDGLGRRLIPYALTAARRAARRGHRAALARLDELVTRLSRGMTAGEQLLLEDLLRRRRSLTVADLLAWDARLPPAGPRLEPPSPTLLAAVVLGALGSEGPP